MGGANRATTLCPERASKALHTKGETRTRKLLVLGTTIALLAITNAPAAAAANDLVCTGEVSSGTYGNVTVPAGNSCQLSGSVVVQGHFVATGAVDVVVSGATIEGNVRIEQSTGSAVVLNRDTTVGGNLEIADNTVEDVILVGSTNTGGVTIVGNVEITGNTAEAVVANASTFMRNVSITHNAATDAVQVDCNVFTGGNVDLSANIATNEGGLIELVSNCTVFGLPLGGEVNGNITMTENVATYVVLGASYTPKNVEFSHNTAEWTFVGAMVVGRNLTCTGNTPDPSTFDISTGQDRPNTVSGKDRCTD